MQGKTFFVVVEKALPRVGPGISESGYEETSAEGILLI